MRLVARAVQTPISSSTTAVVPLPRWGRLKAPYGRSDICASRKLNLLKQISFYRFYSYVIVRTHLAGLTVFRRKTEAFSRRVRTDCSPNGELCLPQRGRGTTAVVDEEIGVCTAKKTSVPKLLCRLQIIDA